MDKNGSVAKGLSDISLRSGYIGERALVFINFLRNKYITNHNHFAQVADIKKYLYKKF